MRIRQLYKILLIVFYLIPAISPAQNRQIDSLKKLLTANPGDTTGVNLLNQLARQYSIAANFPEAKKNAEQALALAEKIKFKPGIKRSISTLGNISHGEGTRFHGQGNYTEALKSYYNGLKYRERIQDKEQMAKSYGNIGLIHWQRYNFSEALNFFFISLRHFEECKSTIGIAGTYNNIGLIYVNQANYPQALKYYTDALTLYKQLYQDGKLAEKGHMVNLYFNIGFVHEDLGSYQDALKNHDFALKICEELKDRSGIAAAWANMAGVYVLMAKKEIDGQAKQQLLKTALDLNLKTLKMHEEDGYIQASDYSAIARVHFEMKEFSLAREYVQKAISRISPANLYEAKETYQLLTTLDSTVGNWEGAFKSQKKYNFYSDSLINDENTKKVMRTQMQYEFGKKEDSLKYQQQLTDGKLEQQILLIKQHEQSLLLKEKELSLIQNEKRLQQLQIEKDSAEFAFQKAEADKKQEQLVVLGKEKSIRDLQLKKQKQTQSYFIAGLVLFTILLFFVYRSYSTRQKLKLLTLRNKIASDLHDDIGSTLSSISIFSQMAQENSQEVKPMLQTIGDSSRKMLDAMADIVWTISPENDQFEKIILRMRSFAYELLGARQIEFRFVADSNISNMKLSMDARRNLYLIFKEATNNLVKYSAASRALFSIKEDKGKLVMMIQDNGKGFDSQQETEGNGLRNMKRRAVEMGAALNIHSTPGHGTTIQLEVAV
jgi:two-component system, NarL family, sensor histidine kinase UhpB